MKTGSKKEIKKVLLEKKLPSHDEILLLSDGVSTVLDKEITSYRQAGAGGSLGGLLDFQSDDLPMIVVPDLHGRTDFLLHIINFRLPRDFLKGKEEKWGKIENRKGEGNRFDVDFPSQQGGERECVQGKASGEAEHSLYQGKHSLTIAKSPSKGRGMTVFKALKKGLIRLVFVGDILHTEHNTKLRWLLAQEDFNCGNFTGDAMSEEMAESLSLWYGVFFLKLSFPEYCHILKGNHENILNASVNGDFGFRKYANEGAMVKAFMQEYYGDDVLYMIHCVEDALPLVLVGRETVVSHAEPRQGYSKEEIINGKGLPYVVAGLTWTDNDEAEEGSVETIIRNLSTSSDISDYVYIGGHRYVKENYSLRQNGKYIQIHNPGKENIALVYLGRKFNPDVDIVSVHSE